MLKGKTWFVASGVVVLASALAWLWAQGAADQSVQPTVAETWILPRHMGARAVLATKDDLYITVIHRGPHRREHGVLLVLDRQGRVHSRLARDAPLLAEAYDPVRDRVYATLPLETGICVIDATTAVVTANISLPHAYLGASVSNDLLFLHQYNAPGLDIVNLDSWDLVGTIPVSGPPWTSVAVGGKLYVSSGLEHVDTAYETVPGKVDVVDIAGGRVTSTIEIPGAAPKALGWDGSRFLYVAASEGSPIGIVRIDTTNDELDPAFRVSLTARPRDMAVDVRQGLLYLSCSGVEPQLAIVDLRAQKELGTIWAGDGTMACQRDNDGSISRLWVPNISDHLILAIDPARLPFERAAGRPEP